MSSFCPLCNQLLQLLLQCLVDEDVLLLSLQEEGAAEERIFSHDTHITPSPSPHLHHPHALLTQEVN